MTTGDGDPASGQDGEPNGRDGEVAERNVRFGLWAADRLGLVGEEREIYALAVHFADGTAPGFDDVIRKVAQDLEHAGVGLPERVLRSRYRDMMQLAMLDLEHSHGSGPTVGQQSKDD